MIKSSFFKIDPSNTVYIGNLGSEISPQYVLSLCLKLGKIFKFRMARDKNSGLSKGFAFCQYENMEASKRAKQKLNGTRHFGRNIRVGYSTHNKLGINPNEKNFSFHKKKKIQSQFDKKAIDSVMEELMKLPKKELYLTLQQMKKLAKEKPSKCKKILSNNPVLSLSLLHIQYLFSILKHPFITYPPPISSTPQKIQPSFPLISPQRPQMIPPPPMMRIPNIMNVNVPNRFNNNPNPRMIPFDHGRSMSMNDPRRNMQNFGGSRQRVGENFRGDPRSNRGDPRGFRGDIRNNNGDPRGNRGFGNDPRRRGYGNF